MHLEPYQQFKDIWCTFDHEEQMNYECKHEHMHACTCIHARMHMLTWCMHQTKLRIHYDKMNDRSTAPKARDLKRSS